VRCDQRALPPLVAPAPERVVEHGLAAPGLLAQLLVGKYCDPLPCYRQEQIYWQRHGVFIARQQLVQWTAQSVRLLEGITRCLKEELQQSGYVQVDETPVRYQDPSLKGRCGQGYLWTGLVPGRCVVYEWHPSRAARCLNSLLGADFAGNLQGDGYSAYPAFVKTRQQVRLIGCWAHTRRGFFAAKQPAPQVAGWILNQIRLLYRGEEQLRQSRAGPGRRQVLRSSHHRMVVERFHRALIRLRPRHLPKSLMGQAISYALNQWPTLTGFLEHGEVEIDNNLVENVRPISALRFLCRDVDNAEEPRGMRRGSSARRGRCALVLGIIKSLQGRPTSGTAPRMRYGAVVRAHRGVRDRLPSSSGQPRRSCES